MLILTKAMLALMIGFIVSSIFGLILIPVLRKMKVRQKVSIFLQKKHKNKDGIPTMGGLIFILSTILAIIILLVSNKIEMTYNLGLVLFVFISYGVLGFIDDYLIIKRHDNEGLSVVQKLIGQIIISIIFFYIFMKGGNTPIVDVHTLGIKINLGWFYGFFILLVLISTSNAVNLTDGLDGLAGGLSVIAFLAFGLIAWGSSWTEGSQDIAIFCFILVGALLGFLLYNTHPAKVFMGDTGSLALGGALASVAIITDHEITLLIVAGVFVIETLSCIIQTVSMVMFRRKVFLMTPLHHHFEKKGWAETDIVKLFWTFGLLLSMAAITFGVWI